MMYLHYSARTSRRTKMILYDTVIQLINEYKSMTRFKLSVQFRISEAARMLSV
jgi:hypothetical protein